MARASAGRSQRVDVGNEALRDNALFDVGGASMRALESSETFERAANAQDVRRVTLQFGTQTLSAQSNAQFATVLFVQARASLRPLVATDEAAATRAASTPSSRS